MSVRLDPDIDWPKLLIWCGLGLLLMAFWIWFAMRVIWPALNAVMALLGGQ